MANSGSSSGAAGGVVAADDGAQASDAKPNFPQMKVLVWDDSEKELKVPEKIFTEWGTHHIFGSKLAEILEDRSVNKT